MIAKEKVNESKAFCIMPWIHFHAWPNGKVFPCCLADSSKTYADTKEESIIKIMNSEQFKTLRLRMLQDLPSEECNRCYDLEKFGIHSLRKSQNFGRSAKNWNSVLETKPDGSIDTFKLKYMDIRFSNICNMKCRSCGPECSSLHAQEYADKKHTREHLKIWFNMDSIVVNCNHDGKFMEKLKPYLNDVEEVYFAGGESLITPEHYELLDHWISKKKTNIRITYTTNFSIFHYKNKNVLDYWKNFENVIIYASLDGDNKVAEYLRKGTEWSEVEKNVELIKSEVPHVEFCLTPTISIWNVHNFPKFYMDWIEKDYVRYDSELRLNLLTHPWYANINILPYFYKQKVGKLWEDLINNNHFPESIKSSFRSVLNALEYEKSLKYVQTNLDGLKEFFVENKKTDIIRNEDLFEAIPELKEVEEWLLNSQK